MTTVSIRAVNDAPQGSLTITGEPIVGRTLNLGSTLSDPDGITSSVTLQWQRGHLDAEAAMTGGVSNQRTSETGRFGFGSCANILRDSINHTVTIDLGTGCTGQDGGRAAVRS